MPSHLLDLVKANLLFLIPQSYYGPPFFLPPGIHELSCLTPQNHAGKEKLKSTQWLTQRLWPTVVSAQCFLSTLRTELPTSAGDGSCHKGCKMRETIVSRRRNKGPGRAHVLPKFCHESDIELKLGPEASAFPSRRQGRTRSSPAPVTEK